jgi:hypothetical protein
VLGEGTIEQGTQIEEAGFRTRIVSHVDLSIENQPGIGRADVSQLGVKTLKLRPTRILCVGEKT